MTITWIISIGAVVLGLVALFLFAVMRTASEHDRAARHAERALRPFSDVPVTHINSGVVSTKDPDVST